jgi:hypothetical protein
MNHTLERIWEEAIVAEFQVLSRHLPGLTEENQKKTNRIAVSWPRFDPEISRERNMSANHWVLKHVKFFGPVEKMILRLISCK